MKLRYAVLASAIAIAVPQDKAWANNNITKRLLAEIEQKQEQAFMQETAQQAFDRWVGAVERGDAAAAAALYADDAVLLPSSSPELLTTGKARRAYLEKFIAGKRPAVTISESHVRVYDDMAVISGIYRFTYPGKKKKRPIPARFSLVYKQHDGEWKIVDHHSSKLP